MLSEAAKSEASRGAVEASLPQYDRLDPVCSSVSSVVKGFVLKIQLSPYSAYFGHSAGARFPASRSIFRNQRNSVRSCSMVKLNIHTAS